jgi:hypothetical protein
MIRERLLNEQRDHIVETTTNWIGGGVIAAILRRAGRLPSAGRTESTWAAPLRPRFMRTSFRPI